MAAEGAQAADTRAWALAVADIVALPLNWRDERLTTEDAIDRVGPPPRGKSGGPPSAKARARLSRATRSARRRRDRAGGDRRPPRDAPKLNACRETRERTADQSTGQRPAPDSAPRSERDRGARPQPRSVGRRERICATRTAPRSISTSRSATRPPRRASGRSPRHRRARALDRPVTFATPAFMRARQTGAAAIGCAIIIASLVTVAAGRRRHRAASRAAASSARLAEANPDLMRVGLISDAVVVGHGRPPRQARGHRPHAASSSRSSRASRAREITQNLVNRGLITDRLAFTYVLVNDGGLNNLQAGMHVLNRTMSPREIATALQGQPTTTGDIVQIALREGLRFEQVVAYLQTLPLRQASTRSSSTSSLPTRPTRCARSSRGWTSSRPVAASRASSARASTASPSDADAQTILEDTAPGLAGQWSVRRHEAGSEPRARTSTRRSSWPASSSARRFTTRTSRSSPASTRTASTAWAATHTLNADPVLIYANDTMNLRDLHITQWPDYVFWTYDGIGAAADFEVHVRSRGLPGVAFARPAARAHRDARRGLAAGGPATLTRRTATSTSWARTTAPAISCSRSTYEEHLHNIELYLGGSPEPSQVAPNLRRAETLEPTRAARRPLLDRHGLRPHRADAGRLRPLARSRPAGSSASSGGISCPSCKGGSRRLLRRSSRERPLSDRARARRGRGEGRRLLRPLPRVARRSRRPGRLALHRRRSASSVRTRASSRSTTTFISRWPELLASIGSPEARRGRGRLRQPRDVAEARWRLQPDVELVPAEGWIEALRQVKEPAELERVAAACAVADQALERLLPSIRAGVTEEELALQLEWEMRTHGAEALAFDVAVLSGPHAALPHGSPGTREVRAGEVLLFDFGAQVCGYRSDMTRTLFVGEPIEARPRDLRDRCARSAGRRSTRWLTPSLRTRARPASRSTSSRATSSTRPVTASISGTDWVTALAWRRTSCPPWACRRPRRHCRRRPCSRSSPGIYLDDVMGVRIEDLVVFDAEARRLERLTLFPREVTVVGADVRLGSIVTMRP